ncbi:metal-binding protein [Sulfurihydrogenibium sp.]|uniref:metal-binding protein n=1 Tax=Sulfurihydrogenibium sp. TaxID=2053621 RepID=UPI00262D5538|nr:metal-binding protein [Sulfurihydrogenibium sp.]
MASGRTHDIVNLLVLPPAVYYLQPSDFIAFTGGYLVGTFFLTPDNDIYLSKPNKRWNILRIMWYPYTKVFKHRGVSHIPIYGTVFKIIYLSVIFFLILFLLKYFLDYFYPDKQLITLSFHNLKDFVSSPFVLSFFIGIVLAEIVHIFTDIIYSTIKKFLPKRRKKSR